MDQIAWAVAQPRLRHLEAKLDRELEALNERFLAEVPRASHMTDAEPLDVKYYLRHRIETIKRIRMTARTDALALAAMIGEDYDAARIWAQYACTELVHDRMFYDDLERQGLSRSEVDATPALPATEALGHFLEERITRYGSLPAVAYSVYVEWNSERFSRRAVMKAAESFGDAHVEGARSHLEVDDAESHCREMLMLAERLTRNEGGELRLFTLIANIAALFRDYFTQLAVCGLPESVLRLG
jgi:hypothetical protein